MCHTDVTSELPLSCIGWLIRSCDPFLLKKEKSHTFVMLFDIHIKEILKISNTKNVSL